MKHKTHHLYYLYYPRGWIIIALFLVNAIATAQEQTPPPGEFPVGSPIFHRLITYPDIFNSFVATGMNTIHQRADNDTKIWLKDYNLVATNNASDAEYICHFTTAYYSKWEAEQNQTDLSRVGVKHVGGQTAFWYDPELNDTVLCWATKGISAPACSLMYGPHYRQEKRYKRWHYGCYNEPGCVTYTPRFRMALDNHGGAGPNEDVCIIKVVFRYKDDDQIGKHHDTTFIQRTLKVEDFDTTGKFDDFYMHENPLLRIYEYPPKFILPERFTLIEGSPSPINYIDWEEYTGIQFWVDWLRTDTLCTLYIDYAEVYDNAGWHDFMTGDDSITAQNFQKIKDYAQSFSDWDNIKYWLGTNEPYTIDAYTPIHIVDSLIRSVGAPPLAVHFDPSWTWNLKINGEDEIEMFYNIAKPEKIILGIYPVAEWWPVIRSEDFEWLRFNFQRTSALDPNFWFKSQCIGCRRPDQSWCVWRKPISPELTSMVMLALAHGAKGIDFEWFDSFEQWVGNCGNIYNECLVDNNGAPMPNDGDTLYFTVRDKLIPRLKGKLGRTLMDLSYTGNYLQLQYSIPTQPQPVSHDYLTLGLGQPSETMNWHCGFFSRPQHPEDKYFMLANLFTLEDRSISVKVKPLDWENPNIRFRNVEGYFDTTFTDQIIMPLTHTKGEGYLYEVAPVIKYGGRLIYSEATQPGMILNDDMIIENGAVLTINGTYLSKANITVKNGRIENGDNGKIQFIAGKKLIIDGYGTIVGTEGSKLELKFTESQSETVSGIMIKAGGSLTISNCIVENATIGIESLLNANYLKAQNVDFINCQTHSISIAGISPGMNPTPPRR
jgi:hypothetical protein